MTAAKQTSDEVPGHVGRRLEQLKPWGRQSRMPCPPVNAIHLHCTSFRVEIWPASGHDPSRKEIFRDNPPTLAKKAEVTDRWYVHANVNASFDNVARRSLVIGQCSIT